jgi:IstB-like ATP binding protein
MVCFGETRKVNWQSVISVGGARYSVPHALIDERVWARADGDELIVVHADGPGGPREVARHQLTTPGRPAIDDQHYPPRPPGALERRPRARSDEERAFLAIGPAAEQWLIKAAAVGAQRVRRKTVEAVDLAKLHGAEEVNRALGACAQAGRFADGDLAAVLSHQQRTGELILFPGPHRGELVAGLHPQLGGLRTMTVTTPPPPPLPDELEVLLRRLRLPYVRKAAPEVIATANSQRWEHAEVLRVLLAEEAAGRDHATTSMRRRSSGLPAGKTFDAWEPAASAIPAQTQNALRTLE